MGSRLHGIEPGTLISTDEIPIDVWRGNEPVVVIACKDPNRRELMLRRYCQNLLDNSEINLDISIHGFRRAYQEWGLREEHQHRIVENTKKGIDRLGQAEKQQSHNKIYVYPQADRLLEKKGGLEAILDRCSVVCVSQLQPGSKWSPFPEALKYCSVVLFAGKSCIQDIESGVNLFSPGTHEVWGDGICFALSSIEDTNRDYFRALYRHPTRVMATKNT